MTSLKKKRMQIDAIDAKLLALLNKRAKIVDQIKIIKSKQHLTTYDPRREAEILGRLIERNQGPLSDFEIKKIWIVFFRRRQMSSSKGFQKRR